MKPAAVILDVDGTLSPEVSWQSLTRDLGASVEAELAVYEDFIRSRLSYSEAKRQVIALWAATGRANRRTMIEIFERLPLDPAAVPLVQDLASRGHTICLISGSVDLYIETIARRLGVEHYYANTELVFNTRGQLTDFHYEVDQGAKKLTQLTEFCRAQSLKLKDCIIVGDGESELQMFRRTHRGILLHRPGQSSELRAAAWRSITTLAEVRAIIEMS